MIAEPTAKLSPDQRGKDREDRGEQIGLFILYCKARVSKESGLFSLTSFTCSLVIPGGECECGASGQYLVL